MKKIFVFLVILFLASCYWQPPRYSAHVDYPGDFILTLSTPGRLSILGGKGELEVEVGDYIDAKGIVTAKASKVSLGDFIDAGELLLQIHVDGSFLAADRAPLGDYAAELQFMKEY